MLQMLLRYVCCDDSSVVVKEEALENVIAFCNPSFFVTHSAAWHTLAFRAASLEFDGGLMGSV